MERIDSNVLGAGGPISRRRLLQAIGAAAAIPAIEGLGAGRAMASRRRPIAYRPWSGDPAELELVYFGDVNQQGTWEALIAAFNESNPDITIKPTGISAGSWGEYITTVATQLAGGKEYDIVYVATEGQRLLASRDILLPLDDYIAADQDLIDDYFADVNPNFLEWTERYGSPDGRTYYLPGGYNTMVMYCNVQTFEDVGVELPETDWTWDEFYDAGVKLAEAGVFLHPMGSGFVFGNIMPWLLTNGASTMNEDWDTATFNTPEAVEAAEFVKRFIDDGLSPVPGGEFNLGSQFADGKLATFGAGRWLTPMIRDLDLVEQTRILNWPTNAGKGTPIGWDAWPIMKNSKNPDAAWAFLRWLTTVEASVYYAEVGGTNVPARNSVANSDAFLANAPAGSELMAAAADFATPIPSPDNLPEVEAAIGDGWTAAITGQRPAQDALDNANEQLQDVL